ncbi:acetoacetate--CoA ligase [Spongiibacter sp. UBA1325]|jgi:acetoacetyl-CoA synthetase|uniref:acetoacetate--CoA ligase n=1 Tax=Spongiibacter sp. UBA1325 TaxID=1947543 RepID=UPI002580FB4F|nr:acetoacetate--CoA ligase [Spongiibacter sp. UBA1325]|tara:strand:+ start:8520 stop:10469 length:1950 start_codon:yes stop_codon:yes gene_type:complete
MKNCLWEPSAARIQRSQLSQFLQQLDREQQRQFDNYADLHRWSVESPEAFWQSVWDFCDIRASQTSNQVLVDGNQFPGARWFPDARLNFAENLLRNRSDKTALISRLENGRRETISYAGLYQRVSQLAQALRNAGVGRGDRVAGFMPNISETVIAMLASASIGAVWSSCSPDFGINGVMDRFGQIQPKVLFACDGYFYGGKTLDSLPRVSQIKAQISSIETLIIVPVSRTAEEISLPEGATLWAETLAAYSPNDIEFEQLPFDHPLYIMYSSGTTGVPKCIVHSAGGSLIQHVKEHRLHTDLGSEDTLFYFSTCGWMMWNWLVSGLACEATLVLYDGSPFYPQPQSLMDMADEEGISIFGTSAKYIEALQKAGVKPAESHQLSALKAVLSTGSPLSDESFRYVYRHIKQDICLSSISGGTDILSCFVLGNPCLPVYEGEIQCLGLGMAVEVWDDDGNAVVGEKGEMVCTRPFPSAPIRFWNDPDNAKYRAAYFDTYPNVWAHGDYGEITEHGGMIIHGRSDAVLNPGGVRIGTAEIYRQVEKVADVVDSICIGQQYQGDVRVVLFVVLREGCTLDDSLRNTIRNTIRQETTPRHVPAKIIAVAEIPRTISGKIVELAVRDVVHGKTVKNVDALANPDALALFKDLPELQ